jgi:hypothetical protein
MRGLDLDRERAWMTLARDLFAALPEASQRILLDTIPEDCHLLQAYGLPDNDVVILKLVEVRAFEVGALDKGFETSVDEKIDLYQEPMIWGSLVEQLAFLQENPKTSKQG